MKIINKVNRGVIIFALLVVGVVIFSIIQHQRDLQLRPEIENNIRTFYTEADTLVIVDELSWDIDVYSDNINIDNLIEELSEKQMAGPLEMNSFLSENNRLREFSYYWLQRAISNQLWYESRIINSETTVLGLKNFSVYQNVATIDVSIRWTFELMYSDGSTETFSSVYEERFSFDREGDRWILSSYNPQRFDDLYRYSNNWY